jgi:hypothetical protein
VILAVVHGVVIAAGIIKLYDWATSGVAWLLREATKDLGQGGP